jgi:ATP-dependent Clp protease adapter protein ClpS
MARLILNAAPSTIERPDLGDSLRSERWVVVVYDNDSNSVEEVVHILLLATGCTVDEAEMETWEVHHLGKSVVHYGGKDECETVSAIISEIGIRVEVYEE